MQDRPSVTVVVCAYTMARWELLERALDSVRRQDVPPGETMLVVDHCAEMIARSADLGTGVTVIPNAGSRGLSGARNTGVQAACGEVVAFLDDDAAADPDWLDLLLRPYADPRVVGVGGHVEPVWAGGRPAWFPSEFGWVVGCSYRGQPTSTTAVRNPIGANMSFRRDAINAVGGFSPVVGRVGTRPVGCEETELSIRVVQRDPEARIVLEPGARVRHHVPAERARWSYFRRRCWAEGLSKAAVSGLTDPRSALATERGYVLSTLPRGAADGLGAAWGGGPPGGARRAASIVAGLAITGAGYAAGSATRTRHRHPTTPRRDTMASFHDGPHDGFRHDPEWYNFDIHGLVGVRVHARAPAAMQLRTMMHSFAVDRAVAEDIVVTERMELMLDAAALEDELAYTSSAVHFRRDRVQVVRDGRRYRVHGPGELLTTVLPLLDLASVDRGAAMIHAATVGYQGHALALPAGGGTGKTSTMAKLMKRPGFTFMGDDWAFLTEGGRMLNYEKPMFIKPHHRAIYPHLFSGTRKPLVPARLSRPVGRLTTVVHPHIVKHPKLADLSRRMSPEHRIVTAEQALPGVQVTPEAPLLASVFVERFAGARTHLAERDTEWMAQRMLGNFHIEMPGFSRDVLAGLAGSSQLSLAAYFEAKTAVLTSALEGVPTYVLQVPSVYSPDIASDDIVGVVEDLLGSMAIEDRSPGISVA